MYKHTHVHIHTHTHTHINRTKKIIVCNTNVFSLCNFFGIFFEEKRQCLLWQSPRPGSSFHLKFYRQFFTWSATDGAILYINKTKQPKKKPQNPKLLEFSIQNLIPGIAEHPCGSSTFFLSWKWMPSCKNQEVLYIALAKSSLFLACSPSLLPICIGSVSEWEYFAECFRIRNSW